MVEDLLEILRTNAKESPETMAKMLGVELNEVERAISKLESRGIIRGWQAIINEDLVPQEHVTAVIEVRVTPEREGGFNRVAERVAKFDEVEAAYLMSGGYDLLLFVSGKNLLEVARFVSEKLSTIHGVLSTATHFRLKTYKQSGVLMAKPSDEERLVVSP
ncbi:MAG: Lrp/AsnC family transcriptional regulator [Lentisphaeraceae bacterium]|nr:Lrp/AsnC family transcriptional regulator [Lentisphaeraceae bacterium]